MTKTKQYWFAISTKGKIARLEDCDSYEEAWDLAREVLKTDEYLVLDGLKGEPLIFIHDCIRETILREEENETDTSTL